jgi:hypothetical protein
VACVDFGLGTIRDDEALPLAGARSFASIDRVMRSISTSKHDWKPKGPDQGSMVHIYGASSDAARQLASRQESARSGPLVNIW